MIERLRPLRRVLAPPQSRRERWWLAHIRPRLPAPAPEPPLPPDEPGPTYRQWIAANEPSDGDLDRQRSASAALGFRPLVSVIMPVYDPEPDHLRAAIESVRRQTYDRWELCIADGGSRQAEVRSVLESYMTDARIKVVSLEQNRGISGNTNAALEAASGEFVAFLDHDDELASNALFEVIQSLNQQPTLDLIFSDHDVLSADGRGRSQPLFKPDWSPDIMLSANYITHLTVIRADLVRAVGAFDPATDGAQDWDLFCRVVERTSRIAHVPKILYHWRAATGSTAENIAAKPYALERQLEVIAAHLSRQGLAQPRAWLDPAGVIRVRWEDDGETMVSIIIPTRGAGAMLERCVLSILERTTYRNYEVLIINNGEERPAEFPFFHSLGGRPNVRVIHFSDPFNYSAVNNLGVRQARGDILVFLNNDTEVQAPDWLDELVLWAKRPGIGAVGARLLYPDGTIQHAGVAVGLSGFAGHPFAGCGQTEWTIFGFPEWYRNWSAVTGACLAIRRSVLDEAGGFDEAFRLNGSDVALGLRLRALGYRNVCNPFVTLVHHESATHAGSIPADDYIQSRAAYLPLLEQGDPYFNPNLSPWSTRPRPRAIGEESPCEFVERFVAQVQKVDQPSTQEIVEETAPTAGLWDRYSEDARSLAQAYDFAEGDIAASNELQANHSGELNIGAINWFIPDFQHAYYGGIHTILRFADHFRRCQGVENRFVLVGTMNPDDIRVKIGEAFPALADSKVYRVGSPADAQSLPRSDAAVATLWTTAYFLLRFFRTKRKFYFVQDFEPLFYPAGSTYAQAEATYRFGFYGIANTPPLKQLYEDVYGGRAESFMPCVDTTLFHPATAEVSRTKGPHTVFFYGRPNHPRNGFELGAQALRRLKRRLGADVRIVAAGDAWSPARYDLNGIVENLGLLTVEETARLYRTCDAGLAMMFTRHPSYLPFELMASGSLVVSNHNPATRWLLRHRENCLVAEASAMALSDALEEGLQAHDLREQLTRQALEDIAMSHSDWSSAIDRIFAYMTCPESTAGRPELPVSAAVASPV